MADVKRILESNPPYGCKVTVEDAVGMAGWNAPFMSDELKEAFEEAS